MKDAYKGLVCPVPDAPTSIQLADGSGGRASLALLDTLVRPTLGNPALDEQGDAARLDLDGARLAFTTDSSVVRPLFFPGGDIGTLAVCGSVNDLAVTGARAAALSCSLILEEGLARETLERVLQSIRAAADACGTSVVTGDTKVVERGAGQQLYISTAAIGVCWPDVDLRPSRVAPGDAILVSGDIGRHGIAILEARGEVGVRTHVESDCASLWPTVERLLAAGVRPHTMRDLTRGGLAAALVEIARTASVDMLLDAPVPVDDGVRGAAELCGFDPMHLACEGRLVAFVPADQADLALAQMPEGARIGTVTGEGRGQVVALSTLGIERVVDLPAGELVPRIC